MGILKAGALSFLLLCGVVALWWVRIEGQELWAPPSWGQRRAVAGAISSGDPVRYLCVGQARIDLKSPMRAWTIAQERGQGEALWPCLSPQHPPLPDATLLVAASTRARTASAALLRLEGGCDLGELSAFGKWEAIEVAPRKGALLGSYRQGRALLTLFCWSQGRSPSLALFVVSSSQ
ncbi:MAG: hypothetical protein MUC50_10435 [Myxococcota bacterium]|jgi:hypothetical protein|nr:hypothetical protein [Myxococcota bacterium]